MSLYLVTGGRDGCIEPLGGNADDVAAVFLSALFPVLIQQRGIVTLHAAGVATEAGGCHRAGATHQRLLSAVEQHVPPAGDGSMGQRPAHFRAVTAMARRVPAAWVVRPWHPFLLTRWRTASRHICATWGPLVQALPARKRALPGIDDDSRPNVSSGHVLYIGKEL